MVQQLEHIIVSDFSTFDFDMLQFSPPKKFNNGQTVWITYQDKKLLIKTPPEMHCPFGLNTYSSGFNGVEKLSINLSFRGHEEDQPKGEFLEFLEQLDNRVRSIPLTDPSWFGGHTKSLCVLNETYNKIVKVDPNGRYAPTMKANFVVGGTNESSLYGHETGPDKLLINADNLPKGSRCTALLVINSVWFMGNKFGVAPRVQQIRCFPNNPPQDNEGHNTLGSGCAFVDDDSD